MVHHGRYRVVYGHLLSVRTVSFSSSRNFWKPDADAPTLDWCSALSKYDERSSAAPDLSDGELRSVLLADPSRLHGSCAAGVIPSFDPALGRRFTFEACVSQSYDALSRIEAVRRWF